VNNVKLSRRKKARIANQILLFILTVVMLYPILWMVSSSLKDSSSVFVDAHSLWPKDWKISNYIEGWQGFGGISFSTFFTNSFIIVTVATIGSIVFSTIIAYGFARLQFRGKTFWFICMMATMMLPFEIIMVPQYIMFNWAGLINTYYPIILPYFFGYPFFVFLIMQFIRTIPRELDEAAYIDGCNKFTIFSRIIVPLVRPAVMTATIFSLYWRWDDFMGPLIYLNDPSKYPVSLALKLFSDPDNVTDWGQMFAMSTASLIPIFIIFLFFQRYIVEGISTTGLKS
jgi:multiple sugar transport system permease protein